MSEPSSLPVDAGRDMASLAAYWKRREGLAGSAELNRDIAARFLELGEPLLAYDVASHALAASPKDVRLRQLRGLALSRSGAIDAACVAFSELAAEGACDEETLGNLARTYKAMWLRSRGEPEAEPLRRQAHNAYLDAYRRTGGYWSAINAAALALAGGASAEAHELAGEALAHCERLLAQPGGGDEYWLRATCGEAALIAGRVADAVEWYGQAAAIAGRRYANVASTRSQARLVCELADLDWGAIEPCFSLPRVVVCTGHLIDLPNRAEPRFPPALATAVRCEIDRRLDELGAVIGFASAACGADLLFHESLAERGSDAVVVLPFMPEQFTKTSVDYAGRQWRAHFDATLARVGEPIIGSSWDTPAAGAAYDYANRLVCGLAKIQADLLGVPIQLLAVWDQSASGELGGTAALVQRWRKQGLPIEHVDLALLRQQAAATPGKKPPSPAIAAPAPSAAPALARDRQQELVAMMFADLRGFHRLSDEQLVPYVERFLAAVADLMSKVQPAPLAVNTWGDGFFATFGGVRKAGQFALRLADLVRTMPWSDLGLPADLSIRIALHAGPVYAIRDPVTGKPGFWGGHVSRAARIEPITPPGQVYASRAFAALARDEGDCDFACDYVGQTPLAKDYGAFPTYHVHRGSPRPGD